MSRLTRHPPITLHLGAHRTATTSLQRLLDRNSDDLADGGLAIWTPLHTRGGLLTGVMGDPGRAPGGARDVQAGQAALRVAQLRARMTRDGMSRLLISDENMLGGLRENLASARLYPSVAARMHRLAAALPGVDRICLAIRSPDAWWTSAFAYLMTRGFAPPDRTTLDAVARSARGWRHVIEDVAASFPEAELCVWSHEGHAKDPSACFALATGRDPASAGVPVLNPSPPVSALTERLRAEGWMGRLPAEGERYAPLRPALRDVMRASHARDVQWLLDGADGIASYKAEGAVRGEGRRTEGRSNDGCDRPDLGPPG